MIHQKINRRSFILAALWSLCFLPFSAEAKLFDPQTFTLKNGLKVIVLTNSRAPVVKQALLYKVGAMDEEPGKSGLAHFLEHLMFKGTPTVSGEDFVNFITRNGGEQNAGTSQDFTVYHQVIHKDKLEDIIRMEADRMVNLTISEEDVKTELPVIIEERRMRIDNEPAEILEEAANAAFYQNHPYRIPTIGWEQEMEGLTREDALRFYKRWYTPNNAILVLAGDVTVEEVKPLVEKYYGVIPSRLIPHRSSLAEPIGRGVSTHLEKRSERVEHPVYTRLIHSPTLKTDKKQVYAIAVLNYILSSGANSILYDKLITQQKVAVVVSTYSPTDYNRGPGRFVIQGQPAPGKTIEEFEKALLAELSNILNNGIPDEEIEQAKRRLSAEIDYIRDNSLGGAMIFATMIGNGFDFEDIENWQDRIGAVTAQEVNQAAHKLFKQSEVTTTYLLPEIKG